MQTETTGDAGGGLNIGFIERGDYVSYAPVNLEELTGIRFRVASGGAGRHDRGPARLADRPAGRLGGRRPDGRLAELGQRRPWTCRTAAERDARAVPRVREPDRRRRRRAVQPQLLHRARQGRGEQRRPGGDGQRRADVRRRAAAGAVHRHGDRPGRRAGRAAHLRVGLRRRRHERRHVDPAQPDLHVRAAGHLPGALHGDRPERGVGDRERPGRGHELRTSARRTTSSPTSSTATRSTPTAGRSSGRTARGRRPCRAGTSTSRSTSARSTGRHVGPEHHRPAAARRRTSR